jgi:hypothetical protein
MDYLTLPFEEVIIRDLVVITFNEAMILFLNFVTFTFLLFLKSRWYDTLQFYCNKSFKNYPRFLIISFNWNHNSWVSYA